MHGSTHLAEEDCVSRSLNAFVEHCLRMALWRHQHTGRPAPVGLIHHSDAGSQDGFNRSSQHLDSGGNYGQTGRLDEGVDGQACHEIAWEAFITAGHRAGVLA